jgi:hypothetical protein
MLDFPTRPDGDLPTLWRALLRLIPQLESHFVTATIGTTETAVAHGLGSTPRLMVPVARGNATVWRSSDPDTKCGYFTASTSVVVDFKVER